MDLMEKNMSISQMKIWNNANPIFIILLYFGSTRDLIRMWFCIFIFLTYD